MTAGSLAVRATNCTDFLAAGANWLVVKSAGEANYEICDLAVPYVRRAYLARALYWVSALLIGEV
jgi:hypothetical protein